MSGGKKLQKCLCFEQKIHCTQCTARLPAGFLAAGNSSFRIAAVYYLVP